MHASSSLLLRIVCNKVPRRFLKSFFQIFICLSLYFLSVLQSFDQFHFKHFHLHDFFFFLLCNIFLRLNLLIIVSRCIFYSSPIKLFFFHFSNRNSIFYSFSKHFSFSFLFLFKLMLQFLLLCRHLLQFLRLFSFLKFDR